MNVPLLLYRNINPYVQESKTFRVKRSAPMDFNMTNISKEAMEDPDRSHDVVNAIYTLVIFFVIFLFEFGGNK